MFMSELPPSYEESQPQGGSSPPTPHTYTTPEMPGAEAGAEAEAGVPPPGTSTVILPTRTSSEDIDASDPSALWENKSIRYAFIRKVFLIVVLQLLVTTSIVAVFTFVDPVRLFIIQNPVLYGVSLCVLFTIYGLAFIEEIRRRFPVNLVYLIIFTLTMSFTAGLMSSYYETNLVVYYLVMMVVVCVTIPVFSFQTKVDFPSWPGFMCVLFIELVITGIITAIVLLFHPGQHHILYSFVWTYFYTAFQVYKTYLLLWKRSHNLNPDEYVFGALYFCTDINIIFALLLQITILSST